ncbi:MAG TPA: adenosylcobinamide-phosphate synthase CbiB [Bauldia sp.]|nr:adenosylcobinamide-phosphate synthase CbiB [Bauldia sp.]
MFSLAHLWMLAGALALDAAVGDPDALWRRAPHPVALLGRLVDMLDRAFNRPGLRPVFRRGLGVLAVLLLVAAMATIGLVIEYLLHLIPYGWIGTVIVAAILLAGRSLDDHVRAVRRAFAAGGLDAARATVSRIVGRDPASLDEAGVCRAAIESTAENFSDGVVAPALWFALLGLPGMFAYKAINTADSMIGHMSPRYERFGWAAARLDDLVNLPASRLAGLLLALAAPAAGGSIGEALRVMRRDAPGHRSPNAGWPEAAMAAALGLALLGPRRYRGVLTAAPYLNPAGRRNAAPEDIGRALRVYRTAWALLFVLSALGGGLVIAFA